MKSWEGNVFTPIWGGSLSRGVSCHPTPRTVEERGVRILLECILVLKQVSISKYWDHIFLLILGPSLIGVGGR